MMKIDYQLIFKLPYTFNKGLFIFLGHFFFNEKGSLFKSDNNV